MMIKPDITFKQLDAIAKKPTLTLGGSYKRLAPSCSIQSLVKLQRPHENHLHAATFQAHLWIGIYSGKASPAKLGDLLF
jgi:hypothetical protein